MEAGLTLHDYYVLESVCYGIEALEALLLSLQALQGLNPLRFRLCAAGIHK